MSFTRIVGVTGIIVGLFLIGKVVVNNRNKYSQFKNYSVELSSPRILARGPMFPLPVFRNGRNDLFLCSARADESLGRYFLVSKDNGRSWSEDQKGFTFKDQMCSPAYIVTQNQKAIVFHWEVKVSVDQSFYVSRFEYDTSKKSFIGPLQSKFIIPDGFPKDQPYWFHGNIVQLPNKTLLAPIQMGNFTATEKRFNLLIFSSSDEGLTWTYHSTVGGVKDIKHIDLNGYQTYGPCEPNLQYLDNGKMIVVARIVNDDINPPLTKPSDSLIDLSRQSDGKYITNGKPSKYYDLGPDEPPIVVSYSEDFGKTWSEFSAIPEARGVFPRMSFNFDRSILLLSYGALKYPRWGNAVQYSVDAGKNWSKQIIISENFTTGYSDIVANEDNSFQIFYDVTPPQPAYNHQSHMINTISLSIKPKTDSK